MIEILTILIPLIIMISYLFYFEVAKRGDRRTAFYDRYILYDLKMKRSRKIENVKKVENEIAQNDPVQNGSSISSMEVEE